MKLYKFNTFTTSYYFPAVDTDTEFLYDLYSAYGKKISRIYWALFRQSRYIRFLTRVDSGSVDFPYNEICRLTGANRFLSFCMGSPGPYQKISILGYNEVDRIRFFAKYSLKPQAMRLTKNEINVYKNMQGSRLTPCLYDSVVEDDFVFLKTEYVKGHRPSSYKFNNNALSLCFELKNYHLSEKRYSDEGLLLCLSHGDFCPWNMLVDEGTTHLIDWEQAADRPLGFDLFTYIAQVTNLITPNILLDTAIKEHSYYICKYFDSFNISDWVPYLKAFAAETKNFKIKKGSPEIAARYDCLLK